MNGLKIGKIGVGYTVKFQQGTSRYGIATIERETKSLWVGANGKRWKKDGGYAYTSDYSYGGVSEFSDIEEYTDLSKKIKDEAKKEELEQRHKDLWREFAFHKGNNWASASLDKLERINKILEEK